jgi:hypothetical protein
MKTKPMTHQLTTAKYAAATGSEPDWKEIAITLWRDVNFAAANLKAAGSGILYNPETGTSRHWKERFADSLELMPGVTVDREAMHAMDLPKKQQLKFFKDREDTKKLSAQNAGGMARELAAQDSESPTKQNG